MRWFALLIIVVGVIDILAAANLVVQEHAIDRKVGAFVLHDWLEKQFAEGTLQHGSAAHVNLREPALAVLARPHLVSSRAAVGFAFNGALLIAAGSVLRRRSAMRPAQPPQPRKHAEGA